MANGSIVLPNQFASPGNPPSGYYLYYVNGGQLRARDVSGNEYHVQPDVDSQAANLVFATNGSNVGDWRKLTPSMTAPNHFAAYNSSADADVTGDGTFYTPVFDTEIVDSGGNYNNTTGVYTAPVTGYYCFECTLYIQQVGAGHSQFLMQLVTSNRTITGSSINPANLASGGEASLTGVFLVVEMDAGDTASIRFRVTASTKTVDLYGDGSATTRFTGYQVA